MRYVLAKVCCTWIKHRLSFGEGRDYWALSSWVPSRYMHGIPQLLMSPGSCTGCESLAAAARVWLCMCCRRYVILSRPMRQLHPSCFFFSSQGCSSPLLIWTLSQPTLAILPASSMLQYGT